MGKIVGYNYKSSLYSNIFFSGGSTFFEGFQERFEKELKSISQNNNLKCTFLPYRNLLTWKGGSIFSSLPIFHNLLISKQEYEEYGYKIIHRKCF